MITNHTRESLIAFEERIKAHFAAGELPCLVHLSGGNEGQLLEIFREVRAEDWVFSTHRSHYHALLKGIPPEELEAEILAGRSMFIFDRERRFATSSILAGVCAMAAGVAWAIRDQGTDGTNRTDGTHGRPRVWCFIGDGAEDNGHTYEAIRYVTGHDLPCTFVIEDNDRQVDTSHEERWGTDERFQWLTRDNDGDVETNRHVRRYHYTPTYPHGGAGLPAGSVRFRPEAIQRFTSGQL